MAGKPFGFLEEPNLVDPPPKPMGAITNSHPQMNIIGGSADMASLKMPSVFIVPICPHAKKIRW
jgi:hypothetical protein